MTSTQKDDPPDMIVIRLWQLPDDFFVLPLKVQWAAMKAVTADAKPLAAPRTPCRMALGDEALILAYFAVTLGLPFVLAGAGVLALWAGSLRAAAGVLAATAVLALHPMPTCSLRLRSSRLALALIRYFTFEILLDRADPAFGKGVVEMMATSAVDSPAFQAQHLPALYLACPHGVFNYGAIAWCCVSRWVCGWYQCTGGAAVVHSVPGLRYLDALIWMVPASRAAIQRALRVETEPAAGGGGGAGGEVRRVGGMLGMVPDGILGAFRSRPGHDELCIGRKRGLLRIACEEGATVYAAWFFGTPDMLTVVQDPFGVMERVSRKLQAGLLGFYGRWGLPVPRRTAVSLVVAPHRCAAVSQRASPTAEEVEAAHDGVYGGLKRAYHRQKAYAGYPNRTLIVT